MRRGGDRSPLPPTALGYPRESGNLSSISFLGEVRMKVLLWNLDP